ETLDRLTNDLGPAAIVVGDETSTEQLAQRLGRPRSWGDALALKNGYPDPRLVQKGQVFYDYDLTQAEVDAANAKWYPIKEQAQHAKNIAQMASGVADMDAYYAQLERAKAIRYAVIDALIASGNGRSVSEGARMLADLDAAQPELAILKAQDDAYDFRQRI